MNLDRRALVALAAAGTLWGCTVPATKIAVHYLPPGWLTVARFGLAALVLLIARRSHLRAAFSPAVLAWGAVGYGGTVFVQNAGVMRTSVSHAALLVGATPVLVAVIAALAFRTVARPVVWLGYAVSLAGVGLVAAVGAQGDASLAGDGLVLASLLLSASFTVAQTRLLPGRDPVAVTAVQMLGATLAMLPVAALTEGLPHLAIGAGPGLPVIIGLALGGTLLPFTLFAFGQSRVSPAAAAPFLNLEPLVGAAIGIAFFGDPLGLAQVAGAAAILAGIAVSSLPSGALATAGRRLAAGRPVPASGPVLAGQLVHEGVDAGVDLLPGRVLVMPGHDLPGALLERDNRPEAGHHAAQLGVVERPRVRLVAEQAAAPARVLRRDHRRGHVHDVGARPGRRGQRGRDLVPGQHVVGGDVERLAPRPRVAEQRDEAAREVRVVGQRPQRGPVPVHHDRPALPHPGHRGPAAVQRYQRPVVGVRGAHDRGGEVLVPVGPDEQVLAGDLVPGVLQERVA
jgi:O-acetylserine/cysteine efflux transporter